MTDLICAIYTRHEGATVLCGQPIVRGVCPVHGESVPTRETGYSGMFVSSPQPAASTTAADVTRLMSEFNTAKQAADRSYRQAISTMGAHRAGAAEVVAFVLEWRLSQTVGLPPGLGPNAAEISNLIVDALRETGHLQD